MFYQTPTARATLASGLTRQGGGYRSSQAEEKQSIRLVHCLGGFTPNIMRKERTMAMNSILALLWKSVSICTKQYRGVLSQQAP